MSSLFAPPLPPPFGTPLPLTALDTQADEAEAFAADATFAATVVAAVADTVAVAVGGGVAAVFVACSPTVVGRPSASTTRRSRV